MTEPAGAPANSPVTGDVPGQSRTPPEPRAPFPGAIPMPVRLGLGYVIAIGARLVLGYFLAVVSGAIVLALLLQLPATFENPHLPHSSTTTVDLVFISAALGAIFGLPYTTLGSLSFWFLAPRRTPVFLLIGTFCPIGALLTMDLVFWNTPSWETPIVLCSIPAGLVATYFYGAVGFGQGFGRWRFG